MDLFGFGKHFTYSGPWVPDAPRRPVAESCGPYILPSSVLAGWLDGWMGGSLDGWMVGITAVT